MIATGRQQPTSVSIPFNSHHAVLVIMSETRRMSLCAVYSLQCGQASSSLRIPQFDRLLTVSTATCHQRLVRMPVDGAHVATVSAQYLLLDASCKVPNARRAVVAAGNELCIGRAETERERAYVY